MTKRGKRQEGVVVKVLERGMPEIVGTYQLNRDFGFVISDNTEIFQKISSFREKKRQE